MKKNISSKLTYVIYSCFIVSTAITTFIVFKDIDHSFAYNFVIGYIIFLVLFFCTFAIGIVMNIRKLKWAHIRSRLYKFIAFFVLLSGLNYFINYGFTRVEPDFYRIISIPLGLSLGLAFFDLAFFRKEKMK